MTPEQGAVLHFVSQDACLPVPSLGEQLPSAFFETLTASKDFLCLHDVSTAAAADKRLLTLQEVAGKRDTNMPAVRRSSYMP